MNEKPIQLFGMTNVLVDYLMWVEDFHLEDIGMEKGNVRGESRFYRGGEDFFNRFKHHLTTEIHPGGSVGNVVANAAMLGVNTALTGARGNDEDGDLFANSLLEAGVEDCLIEHTDYGLTGRAYVFVTPDGQRTMVYDLGSAHWMHPDHLPEEELQKTQIFHTSLYELERGPMRKATEEAMAIAKKAGAKVGLDLANAYHIREERTYYENLIKSYVDILFGNNTEALALTGCDDPRIAALKLEALCESSQEPIAVVTLDKDGALVSAERAVFTVPPFRVDVVDTTGAGDGERAGFYHGLFTQGDVHLAAKAGNYVASRICMQKGARLEEKIDIPYDEFRA